MEVLLFYLTLATVLLVEAVHYDCQDLNITEVLFPVQTVPVCELWLTLGDLDLGVGKTARGKGMVLSSMPVNLLYKKRR